MNSSGYARAGGGTIGTIGTYVRLSSRRASTFPPQTSREDMEDQLAPGVVVSMDSVSERRPSSRAQRERPALAFVRKGDTLVVWKFDRLALDASHAVISLSSTCLAILAAFFGVTPNACAPGAMARAAVVNAAVIIRFIVTSLVISI
jgi:hypothetical protein